MRAGANAITKFPATKQSGSELTHKITDTINDKRGDYVSTVIALPRLNGKIHIRIIC
jgi:hypothetical protein